MTTIVHRSGTCLAKTPPKAHASDNDDTQHFWRSAKLNYFPDTDSLYIDLSQRPSVESQEVSEGVVLDYDAEGNLVGIDIDHASSKLDLRELVTNHIPLEAKA